MGTLKTRVVDKYLERRAELDRWPLAHGPLEDVEQVVAIPVLGEEAHLFDTLDTLRRQPEATRARTLVICVVNNRPPGHADPVHVADNRRVLARLTAMEGSNADLRLALVDASSPGSELPQGDGAGLARKIGLDWGLAALRDCDAQAPLLLMLDADALVGPDYLAEVRRSLEGEGVSAGVVAYEHQRGASPEQHAAITAYELYLRYHTLGLAYADSPYYHHALGSTIVCRAETYAAVSGMNRRLAAEDFYFLEKLIKHGGVVGIKGATVYPSARVSNRAPFGTGHHVACHAASGYAVYHPACYRVLRAWLGVVREHVGEGFGPLLRRAADISPALHAFLVRSCFERTWSNLRRNSPNPEGLLAQFHRWFDGLKTLRLIHHLRDAQFPQRDLFEALGEMLHMTGQAPPIHVHAGIRDAPEGQEQLLAYLRQHAP
ncbi:MAG TPA: hypothetical protein ENN80_08220 [Candidatus Hydrogenedentes bacterium]|nr:hypothetical protein [Candidatus Hydrogenedentota bacterium]